jgi:ribosomal protein L11 methylase PrmA
MNKYKIEDSSFRDPSGFLFYHGDILYRQINQSYKKEYDTIMNSGLYQKLVDEKLIIPHKEVNIEPAKPEIAYKIIQPEKIPFISYPYEWSFSQLKQAALTTLKIQKICMGYEMTLKDASAYNIQFNMVNPIFIDTLSFETYIEGKPWRAYKQFCQHFLAPLALMSHRDIRLNQLLRIYIDGIPLDLTSVLLPMKTKIMFTLMSHIHAHTKSQKHYENKKIKKELKLGRRSFIGIIENLYSGTKKMNWIPKGTEWAEYYSETNYTTSAFQEKKQIISDFLDKIKPKIVWDLGANTGVFSRLASQKGIKTISFDIDPAAIEKNYLDCIKNNETNILPLLLDLTNPTPNIGWDNKERSSVTERGPTDVIFALAIIHHLVISNNVPLNRVANFFKKNCKYLIIEFVPKNDSQVQRLLSTREDIFDQYTQEGFENEFKKYFRIETLFKLKNSERILYIMEKHID